MYAFEVTSNHGTALLKNEDDAIHALWLIGLYHDFDINHDVVKKALDGKGYYEKFPISIVKTES